MSAIISLLGWSFVPEMATSFAQAIYYGITIRAGDPKPQAGSAKHARHHRRIHILLVTAYLVYTIYETYHQLGRLPSYYADLNVPVTATDREIKSRFRRLATLHHPDKTTSEAAAESATHFIYLKLASDTLQDAVKRFAYERFGDAISTWDKCATTMDYVSTGVLHTILPHYAMIAVTLSAFRFFGFMEFAHFYRWLILLTLFLFEVHAVTRPHFPLLLSFMNTVITTVSSQPPLLPFQFIELLREISLTGFLALSQIGPLLVPDSKTNSEDDEKTIRKSLVALEAVSQQLDADACDLINLEVAPFKGDSASINNLRARMREWLVQNTIRSDPEVRDALGTSLRKSREDASAGANGK